MNYDRKFNKFKTSIWRMRAMCKLVGKLSGKVTGGWLFLEI